jgi:hypothetical protein
MIGDTPEFVRWAIERPCPLRDSPRWQDPERTERQLRPLRAYSDAVTERRVFEGICVAEPSAGNRALGSSAKGFRASEILDAYGGEHSVESWCGNCPANVSRAQDGLGLAGCYGWFELASFADQLHAAIEEFIEADGLQDEFAAAFLPTKPRWYGLWVDSRPRDDQLRLLERLLIGVANRSWQFAQRLRTFLPAVRVSLAEQLPLHVALLPLGHATSVSWTVAAHCPRCRAAWVTAARHCRVCGRTGGPNAARTRHARGDRPYLRLERFLGREHVDPFLTRYLDWKLG